jgi:hypothetical protein
VALEEDGDGSEPAPNLVLLADCVYWPALFAPLVETLRGLCAPRADGGGGCEVLMAHTRRWKKDGKFFALASKHLEVTKVHEAVTLGGGGGRGSGAGPIGKDDDGDGALPLGLLNPRTVMRVYRIRAKPLAPPAPPAPQSAAGL